MESAANSNSLKRPNSGCAEAARMAERELSAFFNAMKGLFDAKRAELSAEEWLRELNQVDGLPGSSQEWRSITTKVLARLASRLSALPVMEDGNGSRKWCG